MQDNFKHKAAYDENGNTIYVSEAVKGIRYFCTDPECNKEIIFRNSGNIGKGAKRPHFSHKPGTNPDCSPARALHNVFQLKLFELLEDYISEDKDFIIKWLCKGSVNLT